jgi:Domain of unknown function (DUF4263)
LVKHPRLEERKDIQPFFEQRRHLSAFLASYHPQISRFDRLAFQYVLFGDFTCDVAVGDSQAKAYCFIEFEDAGPKSLFVKQGKKATREWSSRFDHGFSQIIDWFYKLQDMEKSDDFTARFGARSVHCAGILIAGRDEYLQPGEKERLAWRRKHVVVASQHVECVTFDGLMRDLQGRKHRFPSASSAETTRDASSKQEGKR